MECGLAGPSSKNAQPWRFHVVENANALLRIAESVMASDGLDQYRPHDPKTGAPYPHWQSTAAESAAVLSQAPAAVFIENRGVFSGGRRGLSDVPRDGLMQTITGYGLEMVGIGAAIENMWIAAVSLGVSAAFLADLVIAEEQIKAELAITGDVVGALALGYSRAVPRQLFCRRLRRWQPSPWCGIRRRLTEALGRAAIQGHRTVQLPCSATPSGRSSYTYRSWITCRQPNGRHPPVNVERVIRI